MSSKIFDLGKRKVYKSGTHSTCLVIPKQWVADQKVSIEDTVYGVVGITGDIRIFKTDEGREAWAEALTVRTWKGQAAITITAAITKMSGLGAGDMAFFSCDTSDGALIIRKGDA